MQSLTRSRVGDFRLEDALTLTELEKLRDEDKISEVIIAPDAVFAKYPAVTVTEAGQQLVQNGNCFGMRQLVCISPAGTDSRTTAGQNVASGGIGIHPTEGERFRVYDNSGRFYGIYGYCEKERIFKPVKMFL